MGWKTLKERFGIEHVVEVDDDSIKIGSGFVPGLVTISSSDGSVQVDPVFSDVGHRHFHALLEAEPEDILNAIQAEDQFETNIPVYTFEDGKILEKLCEKPGYPNVTHDGCLMYNNRYSTDRDQVVEWAIQDCQAGVNLYSRDVETLEADLKKAQQRLAEEKVKLKLLISRER